MTDSKADLLLHPVRLRLLTALAGRQLTAAELAAALPDVPQATLYRHLRRLTDGGLLVVVAENPVRGLVQKVYALAAPDAAELGDADAPSLDRDSQRALFMAFITTLIASFEQYLASTDASDMVASSVGFHLYPLYLSDAESDLLRQQLQQSIRPLVALPPGPERRRRLLGLSFMPSDDAP
jgi:DNA-binding transcriptional ArsR family regulator